MSMFSFYEKSRNYLNTSKFRNLEVDDFVALSNRGYNSNLSNNLSMISRNC